MNQHGCFSSTFSFLIGIFLCIIGITGIFSNHFLWIFTTNKTLGLIEILLGGLGILMCFRHQSVIYCTLIGWITLGTGTARFVPAADPITIDLLNINYVSAYLFIGIGGCALFSAFMGKD